MHLDEEQLQRLLHGELAFPEEAVAQNHLAGCNDCRGRVTEAKQEEEEVFSLLRQVDHPLPRVEAEAIAELARENEFAWGRWAAGVVLALGLAGAAYAIPGSPLPTWVAAVMSWIGGGPHSSTEAPAPSPASDSPVGGVAVPAGQEMLILFTSSQADGQAEVSLTDGAEIVVRAPSGAATFTSDVDRLVIDNEASAVTFRIEIPRSAPRVEIRVDGERIFLKEGPRVSTDHSADARGPYLLSLRPAR